MTKPTKPVRRRPCYPERAIWGSVKASIASLAIGESLTVRGFRQANATTGCAKNAAVRVSQIAVTPRKTPPSKRVYRITRLA